MDFIHIRPAGALRRAFATWAVQQNPKIRTAGTDTFAVPADAYVAAPEEILLGALVDGHPYVPVEDAAPKPPQVEPESEAGLPAAPPGDTLLGVATPEGLAASQPQEEQGPAGVGSEAPTETGPLTCPDCDREFTSKRGLRAHRRTHTEE